MTPIHGKQIIGSIIVLAIGIGIFMFLWSSDVMFRTGLADMMPRTNAQISAEKDFPGIGKPPIKDLNGYPSVKEYLRKNLNDYDSAEFVSWSDPYPVNKYGGNYWSVDLRLRAKNAFGAKIVKDMKFLIKNDYVLSGE